MKVVQLTTNSAGNVLALTDSGEIYCGFFVDKGQFSKPDFGWRKLPEIPKAAYEYPLMKEPTEKELETARDLAELAKGGAKS